LGENGFYTDTFESWYELDFSGIEGEVTAAQATPTQLYLGFTTDTKSGKGNGGMYRKPLEEFIVAIEEQDDDGEQKFVQQNFPNPASMETTVNYRLPVPGQVCLKITDISGRTIQSLINEEQTQGMHSYTFNTSRLKVGVYFYNIICNTQNLGSGKMLIKR